MLALTIESDSLAGLPESLLLLFCCHLKPVNCLLLHNTTMFVAEVLSVLHTLAVSCLEVEFVLYR